MLELERRAQQQDKQQPRLAAGSTAVLRTMPCHQLDIQVVGYWATALTNRMAQLVLLGHYSCQWQRYLAMIGIRQSQIESGSE